LAKRNNLLFIDDDPKIIEGMKAIFTQDQADKESLKKIDSLLGFENKDQVQTNLPIQDQDDYAIFSALQGEDGVNIVRNRLLKQDPIQVAFVDMHMPPGISGVETVSRLHEVDSNIEIVVVTSYSDKKLGEVLRKAKRLDRILYLRKPFYPVEIRQFALNLCEKYRLERIKDEFVAHISHELSTPLSSVLGFSELLKNNKSLNPKDHQCAEICHSNALFLKNLVEDLIDVARMQRPAYASAFFNGKYKYKF